MIKDTSATDVELDSNSKTKRNIIALLVIVAIVIISIGAFSQSGGR